MTAKPHLHPVYFQGGGGVLSGDSVVQTDLPFTFDVRY